MPLPFQIVEQDLDIAVSIGSDDSSIQLKNIPELIKNGRTPLLASQLPITNQIFLVTELLRKLKTEFWFWSFGKVTPEILRTTLLNEPKFQPDILNFFAVYLDVLTRSMIAKAEPAFPVPPNPPAPSRPSRLDNENRNDRRPTERRSPGVLFIAPTTPNRTEIITAQKNACVLDTTRNGSSLITAIDADATFTFCRNALRDPNYISLIHGVGHGDSDRFPSDSPIFIVGLATATLQQMVQNRIVHLCCCHASVSLCEALVRDGNAAAAMGYSNSIFSSVARRDEVAEVEWSLNLPLIKGQTIKEAEIEYFHELDQRIASLHGSERIEDRTDSVAYQVLKTYYSRSGNDDARI